MKQTIHRIINLLDGTIRITDNFYSHIFYWNTNSGISLVAFQSFCLCQVTIGFFQISHFFQIVSSRNITGVRLSLGIQHA